MGTPTIGTSTYGNKYRFKCKGDIYWVMFLLKIEFHTKNYDNAFLIDVASKFLGH